MRIVFPFSLLVTGQKEGGILEEPENIRRRLGGEVINVEKNPLGTGPNAYLDFALGKKYHPPILGTLGAHGGQVKREGQYINLYYFSIIPLILVHQETATQLS